MPHFFQFFEDFKKNEARFNIKSAVEKLKVPYLIIHGSNDTSVLPIEGENLFSWNKQNKIERIKDADHVFSSKHPWNSKTLPKHLKKVVYLSIDFLNSN
jgi:pimeloyl-ACP methyl ester carboxylesterase